MYFFTDHQHQLLQSKIYNYINSSDKKKKIWWFKQQVL